MSYLCFLIIADSILVCVIGLRISGSILGKTQFSEQGLRWWSFGIVVKMPAAHLRVPGLESQLWLCVWCQLAANLHFGTSRWWFQQLYTCRLCTPGPVDLDQVLGSSFEPHQPWLFQAMGSEPVDCSLSLSPRLPFLSSLPNPPLPMCVSLLNKY